jgi:coproporphyrinogen III oxidase-like Fe-S oxidoreductase
LLFEVRCGTEFTGFSTSHAGIYAALPFCVLKCSYTRRHLPL